MNCIIEKFQNIPTHMDYKGQARAEKLSRFIITLFGIVGLAWGYTVQQFSQTLYMLATGFGIAAFLTIPPWPIYRRDPLKWQKPVASTEGSNKDSKEKKKKK